MITHTDTWDEVQEVHAAWGEQVPGNLTDQSARRLESNQVLETNFPYLWSEHGHHQMINTKIRMIIFFAAKDGEALYS